MKNFLSLLDTKDQSVNINLELSAIIDNGAPTLKVVVNNQTLFDDKIEQSLNLNTSVSIHTPFEVEITMSNKQYSAEKETAVVVETLLIDGWNLVPDYTHLVEYVNDHNNSDCTNYLGFNGIWRLDVDKPFYQWIHQVTGQGWLLSPN